MPDTVLVAEPVKGVDPLGLGAQLLGELNAIASQHRLNAIR